MKRQPIGEIDRLQDGLHAVKTVGALFQDPKAQVDLGKRSDSDR